MPQIQITEERNQMLLKCRPIGSRRAALEPVVRGPPAKRPLPVHASSALKADAAGEPVLSLPRKIAFDLSRNSFRFGSIGTNRLLPLATVVVNADVPLA